MLYINASEYNTSILVNIFHSSNCTICEVMYTNFTAFYSALSWNPRLSQNSRPYIGSSDF